MTDSPKAASSRRRVKAESPASAAGPQPLFTPKVLVVAAIIFVASVGLGYYLFRAPAPFGRVLPPVPTRWQYKGVTVITTSVLKGKIHSEWLPKLAFQPDGSPPIDHHYTSDRGDFSIGFPLGTENVIFAQEDFVKDQVDAQASLKMDQALRTIKISMPFRQTGETLEVYASRIRHELEQMHAVFYDDKEPVDLPAYRFVRMAYRRPQESTEIAHMLFIGPLGVRVLVIDLTCQPEHMELLRPYAEKIIHSFEPGLNCKRAMLIEDPEYGEYAGSGLVRPEEIAKVKGLAPPAEPEKDAKPNSAQP